MIYVSTGGDKIRSAYEYAKELTEIGISAIELSGGIHDNFQLEKLKSLLPDVKIQVHNYFPPPAVPFVLNLASEDDEVAAASMSHVRKAFQWSEELNSKVFSVHAGFLFDPKPHDLGKRIKKVKLNKRENALQLFTNRITKLAKEFDEIGGILLIENNVLSSNNLINFGDNPFLLTEVDECKLFMNEVPHNVALLIDVAHLKVSANSQGFDAINALIELKEHTYAYHLSDNDGISDSNGIVSEQSWFWPFLKKDVAYNVLEVYNISGKELMGQVNLTRDLLK